MLEAGQARERRALGSIADFVGDDARTRRVVVAAVNRVPTLVEAQQESLAGFYRTLTGEGPPRPAPVGRIPSIQARLPPGILGDLLC